MIKEDKVIPNTKPETDSIVVMTIKIVAQTETTIEMKEAVTIVDNHVTTIANKNHTKNQIIIDRITHLLIMVLNNSVNQITTKKTMITDNFCSYMINYCIKLQIYKSTLYYQLLRACPFLFLI